VPDPVHTNVAHTRVYTVVDKDADKPVTAQDVVIGAVPPLEELYEYVELLTLPVTFLMYTLNT
jgi:hypothetical protein